VPQEDNLVAFQGEPHQEIYVVRQQGYHCGTVGAMSISGMPTRKVPYDGIMMPNIEFFGAADVVAKLSEEPH